MRPGVREVPGQRFAAGASALVSQSLTSRPLWGGRGVPCANVLTSVWPPMVPDALPRPGAAPLWGRGKSVRRPERQALPVHHSCGAGWPGTAGNRHPAAPGTVLPGCLQGAPRSQRPSSAPGSVAPGLLE